MAKSLKNQIFFTVWIPLHNYDGFLEIQTLPMLYCPFKVFFLSTLASFISFGPRRCKIYFTNVKMHNIEWRWSEICEWLRKFLLRSLSPRHILKLKIYIVKVWKFITHFNKVSNFPVDSTADNKMLRNIFYQKSH